MDFRTWCALAALAALILGAAGPTRLRAEAGRRIVVAVAEGPRAAQGEALVRQALAPSLTPRDVLTVLRVASEEEGTLRPTLDTLGRALRRTPADIRIAVDDRAPDPALVGAALGDALFVGSGQPAPRNTAFVAAATVPVERSIAGELHAVVRRLSLIHI